MAKRYGTCALCGAETQLTFEHIPPRCAFNNHPAKSYSGDELIKTIAGEKRKPWDLSGLKYSNDQKGFGMYSLCSKCNSYTGKYYGNEYKKFAYGFMV